ncbi:hypothetical protein PSP6_700030 [Paraburkholderia tropica]|nr:hypothetical protein PSP6_700030 [Paraburkholderia tropica]
MVDDEDSEDKFAAGLWRLLAALVVLAFGGCLTAYLLHQAKSDGLLGATAPPPQPSASLVSLVVDGKRHQTKEGKYVVCDPASLPSECRSDLLEQ